MKFPIGFAANNEPKERDVVTIITQPRAGKEFGAGVFP